MLHELNKESLLLLYAADELSASDRADVEQMLTADAGLRAELERLEGTIQTFESGMARLDVSPAAADAQAMRRIGQAMRQRLADQLVQASPAQPAIEPKLRYPWWAYPSVGAAVVLISFVSWWGHRPDSMINIPADPHGTVARGPGPLGRPLSEIDEAQLAEGIQNNFADSNPTQPEKSVASLNAAEDQIAELSRVQSDFRVSDGNE